MTNDNNPSMQRINDFHDAHHWRQYHNAKDLALSISIESAELLELFQWKDSHDVEERDRERLEEELADVLIYAYTLADKLNMDIDDIIEKKLKKNLVKYPVA
ncbi:nucleotide pyrophosphohydrolase [Alloscardovia theropitheci]|uniref:Nucleotide pyrophosphohydrolase n=1 Tax=Alloscardovia theropitheci TaxID=2496842 RepID=A0A4R0R1J7_9BIFI|nr:nucleotide pyrophosphohydrolase [Alloscardovia theropitheci]TCD55026.1 nucleotide pyrophosphohydrolase [Alloscardovia theropitheci]